MAPTFRPARNVAVFFQGHDISPAFNDGSIDRTVEAIDVTAWGSSGVRQYVPGMGDGTVSLSGMHDARGTTGLDMKVAQAIQASTNPACLFAMEGRDNGRRAWLFRGPVTSHNLAAPVSGILSAEVSVMADNGVWSGVVVGARNATGISSGSTATLIPTGVASTQGYRAQLHVYAKDASTARIRLQHSSASVWATLQTWTLSASTSPVVQTAEATGTIKEFVRYLVDQHGGASTNGISFAIGVAPGPNGSV